MKDIYAVDEPLDFTLNIKGHGYFCSDPTAKILYAESKELAYDIPEADMLVLCNPTPRDLEYDIRLEDIMASPTEPVIIGKPGEYTPVIEFGGSTLEKNFSIIDKTLAG